MVQQIDSALNLKPIDTVLVNSKETDYYTRDWLSLGADIITVITLFITIFTLITVRRYKTRIIDTKIVNNNVIELRKIHKKLKLFNNPDEDPLPGNTLANIKNYVKGILKYNNMLKTKKYKSHVDKIVAMEEINEGNLGQLINDIKTILGIIENDK